MNNLKFLCGTKGLYLLPLFVTFAFLTSGQLVEGRIINGIDSDFVAHVARVTGFHVDYSTEGSGTFVTQRHVVTAGSIIYHMSIFYVYYGNTSMVAASSLSGLGFTHPDYDPQTYANDIGMIVLGNAAAANKVTPLPLPSGDSGNAPSVGVVGRVTGFGLIEDENRGWTLNFPKQTGVFRVEDEESCRAQLDHRQELISATHFCTDNHEGLCFGDIGNGLTMAVDGVETLVGVVSVITNMCHGTFPVLFTDVSLYSGWIEQSIAET